MMYLLNFQILKNNEIFCYSLKESLNSINDRVEYIYDEIDIKVESLKAELDNLRDELRNQISTKKDELLRSV